MDRLRRRIIRWLGISFSDISGQITGSQIAPGAVTAKSVDCTELVEQSQATERAFRQAFDAHMRRESRPGGSLNIQDRH